MFVLVAATVLIVGHNACAELPRTAVSTFALGGASRLDASSPLDIYLNPALACGARLALDVSAARLFEMSEFDVGAGGVSYRQRRLVVTLALTDLLGADYYAERSTLLAASISPVDKLRVGAGIEQRHVEFGEGYLGASLYSLSLGAVVVPREDLFFAAAVLDANHPRYCDADSRSAIRTELAASYSTSLVSIALAHHLNDRLPDRLSLGQAIAVSGDFTLLLGIESEPLELSGGFSFKLRGFNFEYGYRNNVYLGGTHRVGLRYSR